ncbi:MAG: tetratricopeptide repeat protein [Treponema sp.]|nr:tetratricopeptide repeat protein [Treponema sp.]
MNTPLDSICYVTLSDDYALKEFAVDHTVPLPVRRKSDDAPGTFHLEELTAEQIIAGILVVLAHDAHNEHTAYYRALLQKIRPNIKKELTETAILTAKNEDFDAAEELFAALRGIDPDDSGTILNTALFLDERGSSYRRAGITEDADACDNDALSYYRMAMDADPPLPDAFFNAGFFHLKRYDYREARDCFESYIALTCDIPDAELGENGIYKKERAQELIDEIKTYRKDDVHFARGYSLIASGEEEKGIDAIRQFLRDNPAVWNAWFLLGWGLRKLGRFDDARRAFEQSLACVDGSDQADTYNELAICALEAGDYTAARAHLERALRLAPENTKILSNMGCLALRQGQPEEAARYFKIVLEYNPNDIIAQKLLATGAP